jgi:hypothetical protein
MNTNIIVEEKKNVEFKEVEWTWKRLLFCDFFLSARLPTIRGLLVVEQWWN